MPDARLTGGCQCGAVRYAIIAPPLGLLACHCHECQKQSASAFGLSLIVARAALTMTQGDTRTWSRPADSGNTVDCAFCTVCGSRVWHGKRGFDYVSVKGGSLDAPVDFATAVHVWTSRKLPGIEIPRNSRQFPGEPA